MEGLARLLIRLGSYVEAQRLGGYMVLTHPFRSVPMSACSDIAFVAADRILPEGEPQGMWRLLLIWRWKSSRPRICMKS